MLNMENKADQLKARQAQLTKSLKALKVVRVEVDYDGAGDSGDVQDVRAYSKVGKTLKDNKTVALKGQIVTVDKFESVYDEATKNWRREPRQAVVGLGEALGDFATDFLSALGIDWYNGEGGYGTVVLDVKEGKLKAEHNERYESSQYSEHVL